MLLEDLSRSAAGSIYMCRSTEVRIETTASSVIHLSFSRSAWIWYLL